PLAALLITFSACSRLLPVPDYQFASSVNVADPRAGVQLARGFHAIEENKWRWTAKSFGVVLRVPPGADQKGARLELRLSVPEAVLAKRGPLTLLAVCEGVSLPPETYTKPGQYTFLRDVPAQALTQDNLVSVDFTADKALLPGEADNRELALVVYSVS